MMDNKTNFVIHKKLTMKIIRINITLFCLILSFTLCAQDNVELQEEPTYTPHQMPRFKGCEDISDRDWRKCAEDKLITFAENQLIYPTEAHQNGIEGIVVINFIVEKDGTISNSNILRDIGGGCGEEALRIVKLMPNWMPGKDENSNKVRVRLNFPVVFELTKNGKPSRKTKKRNKRNRRRG